MDFDANSAHCSHSRSSWSSNPNASTSSAATREHPDPGPGRPRAARATADAKPGDRAALCRSHHASRHAGAFPGAISQFLTPEIPTVKSELDTLKEAIERLPLQRTGRNGDGHALQHRQADDRARTQGTAGSTRRELKGTAGYARRTSTAQVKPLSSSIKGSANAVRDSFVGLQDVEKDAAPRLGEFQKTANDHECPDRTRGGRRAHYACSPPTRAFARRRSR